MNTVTNETPHKRFNYQGKSAMGYSVPTWLNKSRKVLVKRFVKNSKYEPNVTEVELLEVKYPNGRESTVSLKHLAPIERNYSTSQNDNNIIENQTEPHVIEDPPVNEIVSNNEHFITKDKESHESKTYEGANSIVDQNIPLQRSSQILKPPVKLNFMK